MIDPRDAVLLAEAVGKNPAAVRSWFYLAQTYRDLDRVPDRVRGGNDHEALP